MTVSDAVDPLGLKATPSQDWPHFRLFCCDFQEEAKASEVQASRGVGLRKNIFKEGDFTIWIVSLAIVHFVFNFSPSSLVY